MPARGRDGDHDRSATALRRKDPVPRAFVAPRSDYEQAVERFMRVRWRAPLLVITGAGCSTESGIPDYRGPVHEGAVRRPMLFDEFKANSVAQQRYWARAYVGWQVFEQAKPNLAHVVLAEFESRRDDLALVTQNVDGLHDAAGSRKVLELHGTLHRVRCLRCGAFESRSACQRRLAAANAGWAGYASAFTPDGDAEVALDAVRTFRLVGCRRCDGPIKPDVVFFGEAVPGVRHRLADEWVAQAGSVWLVGTSLAVWSVRRLVVAANARQLPVGLINVGSVHRSVAVTAHVNGLAGPTLAEVVTVA